MWTQTMWIPVRALHLTHQKSQVVTSPLGASVLSLVKHDDSCDGCNGLCGSLGRQGLPEWWLWAGGSEGNLRVQVPMRAHVTQINNLIDPTYKHSTF